jgi:hypothetical protein
VVREAVDRGARKLAEVDMIETVVTGPEPASREPTLAELTTRAVRGALPYRLAQLLQLAVPFAIDFAARGWWRAAAGALALAAFGAWGLTDRWLWTSRGGGWRERLLRVGRAVTGTLATALPAGLLLEGFLRLLGKAPIS